MMVGKAMYKNKIPDLFLSLFLCSMFFVNATLHAQALTLLDKAQQEKINQKYSKANYYYFKILSKQSNNEAAIYGLAHSFHCMNQNDRALQEVNKLIAINLNNEKALELRARINVQNQLWNNVLSDVSHIIEINPANAMAYMYMDNAYTALGNQKAADEALKQYREIKALEKNINMDKL